MKLAAMYKTVYFFLIAVLLLLVNACDNNNDFADIEEAIKLNKLNITSIVVEASLTKTVQVDTTPCDTQNLCDTYLPIKKTEPFKAYGFTPDNKKTDITSEVAWSTSDSTKAQVDQSGNLTTQSATGVVDVIATLGSVVGKTTVKVSSSVLIGTNIRFFNGTTDVTGTTPAVTACETYPLTVLGKFEDGSTRNITHDVTWSVEDGGSVTQNAEVKLNDANQGVFSSPTLPTSPPYVVKVSYLDTTNTPAIGSSLNVSVSDPSGTMSIAPVSAIVAVDATYQFSASINDGASMDVTSTAKWNSDDTAAAVSRGLVTGVNLGTANITASCGSLTKTAAVTVENNPQVAFLTIEDNTNTAVGANVYLTLNDSTKNTVDLSVIVTYYDHSTADITADLTQPTIVADDGDTTLQTPISTSFVTSSDLTPVTTLRITAQRVGGAMMTVNYSGLAFYQHIIVN